MTFYSKFLAKVALWQQSDDEKDDPDDGQDQAAEPELLTPGEDGDRGDSDGDLESGHCRGERNMFAQVAFGLLFGLLRFFSDIRFFAFVPDDIGAMIFDRSIGLAECMQDLVSIDGDLLFEVLRLIEIPLIGGLGPLDQRFIGMVSGQQSGNCGQHGHQGGGKGYIERPFLPLLFRFLLDLFAQMFGRYFDLFRHIYLLRYILRSLYNCRKLGSRKSLMNRMASPVDFISGPSSLLTPGNLLKLKTGSLIANPFSFFSNVKSPSLLAPIMILVAILR